MGMTREEEIELEHHPMVVFNEHLANARTSLRSVRNFEPGAWRDGALESGLDELANAVEVLANTVWPVLAELVGAAKNASKAVRDLGHDIREQG